MVYHHTILNVLQTPYRKIIESLMDLVVMSRLCSRAGVTSCQGGGKIVGSWMGIGHSSSA